MSMSQGQWLSSDLTKSLPISGSIHMFFCFQGHHDSFMARNRGAASTEIIVEFIAMGSIMRVSAMDTASLTEVFIQGPINADQNDLAELAKQKLAFVLAKKGHRGDRS